MRFNRQMPRTALVAAALAIVVAQPAPAAEPRTPALEKLLKDAQAEKAINIVWGPTLGAAEGAKGEFIDGPMEAFFSALATRAGFCVDLLVAGDRPRAALFGHEDDDGYYLYNSAYDPMAAAASPGMVLLIELIAAQIARGAAVLDFMKGDEEYKFRLGAEPRHLIAFAGDLP